MKPELKIPLVVDLVVILAAIYGYGVLWTKVDTLVASVTQIQMVVEAERTGTSTGRESTAGRLSALEAEVRLTREDTAEIKRLLREDRR